MVAKSHIFSEMLNSVGGIVYTRNRYCQLVGRARVHPVDVNSNRLEVVRALFSGAVTGWAGLTQDQRDAWINYADQTPWKNALGDTVYLTGQAMYIAIRCTTKTLNPAYPAGAFDVAPGVPGLAAQPTLGFDCCLFPLSGIRLSVFNNHTVDMNFYVYPSPSKSPSKLWYQGPYKYQYVQVINNLPPETSALSDCFECEEGARKFFMVRGVESATPHVLALPVYGNAICCIEEIEETKPNTKAKESKKTTTADAPAA